MQLEPANAVGPRCIIVIHRRAQPALSPGRRTAVAVQRGSAAVKRGTDERELQDRHCACATHDVLREQCAGV